MPRKKIQFAVSREEELRVLQRLAGATEEEDNGGDDGQVDGSQAEEAAVVEATRQEEVVLAIERSREHRNVLLYH